MVKEKQCCRCKQIKLISEFTIRNSRDSKDGYSFNCKRCESIRVKRNKIKNNTPEQNVQYLYNMYLRGETIDDFILYFEVDKSVIIEVLSRFGIILDQENSLYCSRCSSMKNITEFVKSNSYKRGYKSWCNTCNDEYNHTYYNINSDDIKLKTNQYYHDNHEIEIERRRFYYHENKHRFVSSRKEYRKNIFHIIKQKQSEYYHKNKDHILNNVYYWRQTNIAKVRNSQSKYRAAKLKAIPLWANKDLIFEFYEQARKLTDQTGILHVVDYIIPLQGKNVCGLHVQNNLQVLTHSENCRKSNTFNI